MRIISSLIRDHRALAMFIVALALCAKAIIPQGYMLGSEQKVLTVQLCYDGFEHRTAQIALPVEDPSRSTAPHGDTTPDQHCAFSSLSMGTLGGADAPLLEEALLFLLALGFAPATAILPERPFYILPPLRGPPTAF